MGLNDQSISPPGIAGIGASFFSASVSITQLLIAALRRWRHHFWFPGHAAMDGLGGRPSAVK